MNKTTLKKDTLVKVISGAYKGKIQNINTIKGDKVTLKNILGLSSKKKPYFIKINKSNVKIHNN